jgi:MFS family permease
MTKQMNYPGQVTGCNYSNAKSIANEVEAFLFVGGILTQILLAMVGEIVGFTLIRMIQTGLIAATIPIVISIFAADRRGNTIGFLNSARFAGNALGSILATSLLAFSNLTILYLSISAMTLFALVGFRFSLPREENQAIGSEQ